MRDLPTANALLNKINPLQDDGTIVNADSISTRLTIISAGFASHAPDLSRLITDTATLLSSDHRAKSGSWEILGGTVANPSRGTVKTHRTAAALTVANDGRSAGLADPIRALIVVALIKGVTESPAQGLTQLLLDFDSASTTEQKEALEKLSQPVYLALSIPTKKNIVDARNAVESVLQAFTTRPTPAKDLWSLINRVLRDWPTATKTQHLRPSFVSTPVDDGSLLLAIPSGSDDEFRAADYLLPFAPPEAREFSLHTERNAAERSGFLLASALQYGQDQSLLTEESVKTCHCLLSVGIEAIEKGDRLQAGAAAAYLVSFITGEGSKDCALLRLRPAQDDVGIEAVQIDLDRGIWSRRIPRSNRFWKPSPSSKGFCNAVNVVNFPFPAEILSLLRQIDTSNVDGRDSRVLSSNTDQCDLYLKSVSIILKKVTPRFSDGRLRLTLAAVMLRNTRESCNSFILLGNTLGQSPAPLHYYAVEHGELLRVYSIACLQTLGFEISPSAEQLADDTKVGAPLATLKDVTYREYVEQLKAATRDAPRNEKNLKKRYSYYSSMARYTAAMWGATTGHRGNNNIGNVSLSNVDARGWAVMTDKPADSSSEMRLVILGNTLIRQVENLRLAQKELQPYCTDPATRKALQDALTGRGPLFIVVDSFGFASKLTAADLHHPWLQTRDLPRNWLRSRLRSNLTAAGVSPELVYRQLGHVNNGLPPYGPICPSSVSDVADLLMTPLDDAMAKDGWIPLPAEITRQKRLQPWAGATLSSALQESWKSSNASAKRDWNRNRLQRFIKEAKDKRPEIEAWVISCLKMVAPHHTTDVPSEGVNVSEANVVEWIDALNETDPSLSVFQYGMSELRKAIDRLRRERHWTGVLPPRALDRKYSPPPIGTEHIQAGRLTTLIRAIAIKDPIASLPAQSDKLLCRLALLLITDYAVLNKRQLLSVIDDVKNGKLVDDPDCPERALCELALESGQVRTVRLSVPATLAAKAVAALVPHDSDVSVERLVRVCLPADITGKSKKDRLGLLFSLQTLSLRIDIPGVVWSLLERHDWQTVTLDRTLDYRADRIRALESGPASSGGDKVLETLLTNMQNNSRVPPERKRQYMDFRRELGFLRESTSLDQGLDKKRFTKARLLITTTLSSGALDESVRLFVLFTKKLLEEKPAKRISTVYDYLTQVGELILGCLDDRAITDLDDDELDDVFTSVIEETTESRKSQVASTLLRFYYFHEAVLACPDLVLLHSEARTEIHTPPRVNIVTHAEYLFMRDVLDSMLESNNISMREHLQAKVILSLMWYAGLRTREITHRVLRDVINVNGLTLIYVHSTILGLVKTRASRRLLNLSATLPSTELSECLQLAALSDESDESDRVSPPLFLFAKLGESKYDYDHRKNTAADLMRIVRETLRATINDRRSSLHSFRHSAASRLLFQTWSLKPVVASECFLTSTLSAVSGFLGHSRFSVSFEHYWHLSHLCDHSRASLTSDDIGRLMGKTGAAVRMSKPLAPTSTKIEERSDVVPECNDHHDHVLRTSKAILKSLVTQDFEMVVFAALLIRGHNFEYLLSRMRTSVHIVMRFFRALNEISIQTTLKFWPADMDFPSAGNNLIASNRLSRMKLIMPSRSALKKPAFLVALSKIARELNDVQKNALWSNSRRGGGPATSDEKEVLGLLRARKIPTATLPDLAWVTAVVSAHARASSDHA